MKNRMRSKQNSGFTLVETLAVVGIVIILLGLSMVSVIPYIDMLKIAELDNAAREIYMAAENRAVLLSGAQRLDVLLCGDGVKPGVGTSATLAKKVGDDNGEGPEAVAAAGTVERYYVSADKIVEDLLTMGSIDPTLLDSGDFFIVYDLDRGSGGTGFTGSGSVTDVFYAEKGENVEKPLEFLVEKNGTATSDGFAAFYSYWTSDRSTRLGLKKADGSEGGAKNPNQTLVGWYSSRAASGGGSFKEPIEVKPYINVEIVNREELAVTVTVKGEYVDQINSGAVLEVRLKGSSGYYVTLGVNFSPEYGGRIESLDTNGDGVADTIVGKWVLDSLKDGANRFRDIVQRTKTAEDGTTEEYYIVTPGDNFTVEATVTKGTEVLASADDKDNSLFWNDKTGRTDYDSGDDRGIAFIKYLRHLQNLDAAGGYESGVAENNRITKAQQAGDILGDNNETYPYYPFIPIVNDKLESYTVDEKTAGSGNYYAIRNLRLKAEDGGTVGLFKTAAAAKDLTLEHIRMVNTKVSSDGALCVGALAGETSAGYTTTIDDCWVYLEADRGLTSLQKLVKDRENDVYEYQLTGRTVGGLVGTANGTAEIKNSLAATLIQGKSAGGALSYAGGLVGQANVPITVDNSYTDCYFTGDANTQAAGLIGNVKAITGETTVRLNHCYTAGFILNGGKAAGLCLGGGITNAHNVYTVILYPNWKNAENRHYLTENHARDTLVKTCYLGSGSVWALDDGGQPTEIQRSSLQAMKRTVTDADDANTGFANAMGGSFVWKSVKETHTYELRTGLVDTYIYPGLNDTDGKGIPHYGDWGDILVNPTLVYYERYGNGANASYGVNGINVVNSLNDGLVIEEDGYALIFPGVPGEKVTAAYTVKYTDEVDGSTKLKEIKYSNVTGTLVGPITVTSQDGDGNWTTGEVCLLPLPEAVVNNSEFASEDFYQYIKIELTYGQTISKQFIFNPHFACAVEKLSEEGDADWPDTDVLKDITDRGGKLLAKAPDGEANETYGHNSGESDKDVIIRTPRHLYFLSVHEEYYGKGCQFLQELNLDYKYYTGYGKFISDEPFDRQEPIGSESTPFLGYYNGDYHTIANVVPGVQSAKREREEDGWYWGLFGYSKGTLENIVYQLNPDQSEFATVGELIDTYRHADKYVGVLAGGNGRGGLISNCAVWGINLTVSIEHETGFIGGLVGQNLGTVEKCEAEFARLYVNYLSGIVGYTGGLVGINGEWQDVPDEEIQPAGLNEEETIGKVVSSYAVGFIEAMGDALTTEDSRICGFAGYNSGVIESSYSATRLLSAGSKVTNYSFCGKTHGTLASTYYLGNGNFTYRKNSFGVTYIQSGADEKSYDVFLTGEADAADPSKITNLNNPFGALPDWGRVNVSSMETGRTGDEDETAYPYPASVTTKDKAGNIVPIHYGSWPGKMAMGGMGVFYWEKLVIGGDESTARYSIYALAVDEGNITRRTTLSESHADGGAVTEYGYGYYYRNDSLETVKFSTEHINFATYDQGGVVGEPFTVNGAFNDKVQTNVELSSKTPPHDKSILSENSLLTGYQKMSEIFCGGDNGVNLALQEQMPEFTFWAWPCFHEGGRPAEIYTNTGLRTAQSTSGLTPNTRVDNKYGGAGFGGGYGDVTDKPLVANEDVSRGTFTLTQGDLSVTFVVNAHFAAALSVDSVIVGAESTNKTKDWASSRSLTDDPGSSKYNPFQVRCGLQMQNINTFVGGNCASPVGLMNANAFIYLTSDTKTRTDKKTHFDGELYWVQTHDMDMAAEGAYYYVCVGANGCKGAVYNLGNNSKTTTGGGGFVAIEDVESHTCDLKKEPGVFYSIAANHMLGNYDQNLKAYPAEGQLMGYFAGDYDGQNFTMKNFKIVNVWEQRYQYDVNCVGLFGAVKNAHLKDIVMYAEDDNSASSLYIMGQRAANVDMKIWTADDTDRGSFGKSDKVTLDFPACPGWYAGGVLAGVALDSTIEGCAVAGYTIYDMTQVAGGSEQGTDKNGNRYDLSKGLGGAVGGLVGLTNSPLDGCTAVVKIVLEKSFITSEGVDVHYDDTYNHKRHGLDGPVRVGGLVGSTTSTVTNCYTGGSITVSEEAESANVYTGRIIGGTGVEPFSGTGDKIRVEIKNCYSYMNVTGVAATDSSRSLTTTIYNIGGSDKGESDGVYAVALDNNYYLTGIGGPGDIEGQGISTGSENPVELTYAKLAGTALLDDGSDIYAKLNIYDPEKGEYTNLVVRDGKAEPYFIPVTDKVGGLAAAGRFSYVPKTKELEYLQGYDYPFPTVLIQRRNDVEGGVANVHYGEWPGGIIRAEGNQPLYLNAFADNWESLETLTLAEGIASGGTWSVTWEYGSLEDGQGRGDPIALSFAAFDGGVTPGLANITEQRRVDYLGSGSEKEQQDRAGVACLYIAALRECQEPVTVTVHYTLSDSGTIKANEYTLDIIVYITADETKAMQGDMTVYALDTLEEAETLCGESELELSGGLKYMNGIWTVDWVVDGEDGANGSHEVIDVSFGENKGQQLYNIDDGAWGSAALCITTKDKDKYINATVTVKYTVYKLDENGNQMTGDDGIAYEYTRTFRVCITDSLIKMTNSSDNLKSGNVIGDVFNSGSTDIFGWANLSLNELFSDVSGTWTVSWVAGGVEKSQVIEDAYLTDGKGGRLESPTGRKEVSVGIKVRSDITGITDDTSHKLEDLKDAAVTIKYTTVDGVEYKLVIPVNLASSNVGLVADSNRHDTKTDIGTIILNQVPLHLWVRRVTADGNLEVFDAAKRPTLTITRTEVSSELLGAKPGNVIDIGYPDYDSVVLWGEWPDSEKVQLTVTYETTWNGYIKEHTETFTLARGSADLPLTIIMEGNEPLAVLPPEPDAPEIPESREVTDSDPVESEAKDPDWPEMEIPEPPEEPEDRAAVYDPEPEPEPELITDVPPKPKDPEDDPASDDPDPGDGPEA